jgi:hypothetical protein
LAVPILDVDNEDPALGYDDEVDFVGAACAERQIEICERVLFVGKRRSEATTFT